ncbi:hypothetical protein P154DRAFT_525700 [Amniculicola lignicola CBS 123094]|uniref:Exonuclease domain-containing protein n=1 Tax=Amniculicola lignicola CBS 123094 TaxID=1392246 RepID=A0A6A5W394_9PLEO|nr:hypothetical protein P154DRAFT_525700 [Amniculicola lignicola CBS 123094]
MKRKHSDRHKPPSACYEAVDTSCHNGSQKKQKKKKSHPPAIYFSPEIRLRDQVQLSDIQGLILYLLADGVAPRWVGVRSREQIGRVVVLMVPGLELDLFNGETRLDTQEESESYDDEHDEHAKPIDIRPRDIQPRTLHYNRLPGALKPLADVFSRIWSIKGGADFRGPHQSRQWIKVHSPITAMLRTAKPLSQEQRDAKNNPSHKGPLPQSSHDWKNDPRPVTEFLATRQQLLENNYVLHPAFFESEEGTAEALEERRKAGKAAADGWVDTNVATIEDGFIPSEEFEQDSLTAGRQVLFLDCEMCLSNAKAPLLTRISILDWTGNVLMDKLVKPDEQISDYVTAKSGITEELLHDVTTKLADIQKELLELITPRTILVGHSLESDLNALKLTHPFIIDTSLIYPNPAPPAKHGLRWLTTKYLGRFIQQGTAGHNSVEDSRACLDLLKMKCEKGPLWGSLDMNTEPIFTRLGRTIKSVDGDETKKGAVVDWGDPARGTGIHAQVRVACRNDSEVVEGIISSLGSQQVGTESEAVQPDYVWGRLRELELVRGWWDGSNYADQGLRKETLDQLGLPLEHSDATHSQLVDAVKRTVHCIRDIYKALPDGTAFIVYSGTSSPRELRRLLNMRSQYYREQKVKPYEELTVKWTDTENLELSEAIDMNRQGAGFMVVK